MSELDDHFFPQKPTTPDEFIKCLIKPGWDPSVVFMDNSKYCLNLNPDLIKKSIEALSQRDDLSRYTYALTKIVCLSDSDKNLKQAWQNNLKQLRALTYTSAFGTMRQRNRLLEIAENQQVVDAMLYALKKEAEVVKREIEPSWLAVLYAEGSMPSIKEADRFTRLSDPEHQASLRDYNSNG